MGEGLPIDTAFVRPYGNQTKENKGPPTARLSSRCADPSVPRMGRPESNVDGRPLRV